MPGTQVFTYCNYGKETTRGTPVAPTRQFYVDGTGILQPDNGQNFHDTENAGIRTRTRRVTRQSEDVAFELSTPAGVSFDDLILPFSQLKGGVTGTGASADKTWTYAVGQTAANSPEAYSLDVGDDIQNWRLQYAMLRSFKLSAGLGDVTQFEASGFAQRMVKTAKATPAINSSIKIPSELWTIKFATSISGLAGASISTNFLRSWDLEVMTGLVWEHTMSGNLYGSGHVETFIDGTLNMTVDSTALAISEFYDKAVADTMSFIRLKAIGPALGGSFYSAQIDLPVLYETPQPISGEELGINTYDITARIAYDSVSAASIAPVLVNSLAVIP